MVFLCIIISVMYIWLLRFIVKPLLFISMILVVGLFIGLGGYAWVMKDATGTDGEPLYTSEDQQY